MSNTIHTVLYDPKTKSLFAGDKIGNLHQYQRSRDEDPFELVKDHGDIGIGNIYSSCLYGDLAFFGGWSSTLTAVRISEKKLVEGTFETAIRKVYSLEACRVSDSRVLISVGGGNPSYSESLSDVLEIKCEAEDSENESQTQSEFIQKRTKKAKKQSQNGPQKLRTQTKNTQTQIQTDTSIPSPTSPLPPDAPYSERVLVDFMSKVLVYVQTLFEDFVQKSQPMVVNKPYISK